MVCGPLLLGQCFAEAELDHVFLALLLPIVLPQHLRALHREAFLLRHDRMTVKPAQHSSPAAECGQGRQQSAVGVNDRTRHAEPRGVPVQWADPGIKPERLSVTMRSERY